MDKNAIDVCHMLGVPIKNSITIQEQYQQPYVSKIGGRPVYNDIIFIMNCNQYNLY
jgi:hypothetical protein